MCDAATTRQREGCRILVAKVGIPVRRTTLNSTITAIVERSKGVRWDVACEGLALVRTETGYQLTTTAHLYPDALPGRVVLATEDGHLLTARERERAVRSILMGA